MIVYFGEPIQERRSKCKCNCVMIIIGLVIIVAVISIIVYFSIKSEKNDEGTNGEDTKDKPIIITENHRTRISLLQECMKAYNVEDLPILQENTTIKNEVNDKILSISTLEMNIFKGKSFEIFKNGFELQEGEYACISYELKKKRHMIKIDKGVFGIPDDFNEEISETPFTLILYFDYDPSINEDVNIRNLENKDNEKYLSLYNNTNGNNKILLRKLNIFKKIKNYIKKIPEKIVEKVIEKTVSYACVSLAEFLFQEFYDIIQGIAEFACDELGEFAGNEITKLIYKSDSKPKENYREIIYEESLQNNLRTYPRDIFSISYLKNKLEKIEDKQYIEIKKEDFIKYASDIIPSEEILTKHNHIFNPLGNLILAELSSAYLKPILIGYDYQPEVNFLDQYIFQWTYTDKYNEKEDFIELNTFLADDRYVLFNNLECKGGIYYGQSPTNYEFYIAIQKIGEAVIKIYKNPEYVFLEKYSNFKAAFWIKNIEDIKECFHFNNIHSKFIDVHLLNYRAFHHYVYAYKKINLAEYNISKYNNFINFITFTSAESIIMPFYSHDDDCVIDRFICNNYRLKNINWNEFSISSLFTRELITYSPLEGLNLDLKFIKFSNSMWNIFQNTDLTNANILNFDISQVTYIDDAFYNTIGNNFDFIKNLNTSKIRAINGFISNNYYITKIDISKWNKISIKEMAYFLASCKALKYANLAGYMKIENDCNFKGLFLNSNSLEAINIKGWDFSITENKCNDNSILDNRILSSVKIYIDVDMYNLYLDKIKKFFAINNNNQFITSSWPFNDGN